MPSPSGSGSAKSGSTFGNDLFGYLIHLATLYQRPPGAPVVPGSNSHQLGALFEELYKDPAVVAYVYSRLNGIGKVFINRLILVHRPIQQGVIRHWISSLHDSDHSKYRAALSQLTKLHILLMDPKGQHLRMSSNFRQRLHEVFLKNTSDDHQSPPWEILEEAKVDVSKVDGVLTNGGAPRDAGMNRLDEYAALRWEYVLEAMVDGMTAAVGDASLRPEGARQGLSGIVGMSSTSTSTGQLFQFVLASRTSQYWELVRRAFDMIERQHGIQSLLAPIRMVVALTRSIKHEPERLLPGTRIRVNPQCMATPGAKGAVTTLLETLADLGIVVPATYDDELRKVAALQRQYGESVKYELPLVSSDSRMVVSSLVYVMQASRSKMMMSVDDTTAITNKSCRLFVDSNFAVTAYTTSSLDLRLLGTFVQLQRQLGDGREYDPNDFGCVLGTLTQSSVQSAAQRGVTSEYIISYLKSHVDPRAAHMGSQGGRSSAATANTGAARGEKFIDGIPANVVTQITLWEREAIHNRLRIDPGVAIQNPAATTAMDQFTGMTQSEEAAKYVTRMMQACGPSACLWSQATSKRQHPEHDTQSQTIVVSERAAKRFKLIAPPSSSSSESDF